MSNKDIRALSPHEFFHINLVNLAFMDLALWGILLMELDEKCVSKFWQSPPYECDGQVFTHFFCFYYLLFIVYMWEKAELKSQLFLIGQSLRTPTAGFGIDRRSDFEKKLKVTSNKQVFL